LIFALIGGWNWAGWIRGDGLARRLALWGCLGGAVGFPLGQCLQSLHAWHPEWYRAGLWMRLDPVMNWWNWMETTFGTIMGGILGFGLWLNRDRIREHPPGPEADRSTGFRWEWVLLAVHLGLLLTAEFGSVRGVSGVYNHGLLLCVIPMACVVAGSRWPMMVLLPVTLAPIAGKTFVQLVLTERFTDPIVGGVCFLLIPMTLTIVLAAWSGSVERRSGPAAAPAARVLLTAAGLIYSLNFAFFHLPWPWAAWTYRTPNNLYFTVALLALSALAVSRWHGTNSSKSSPA
jgi:hypothetical protein